MNTEGIPTYRISSPPSGRSQIVADFPDSSIAQFSFCVTGEQALNFTQNFDSTLWARSVGSATEVQLDFTVSSVSPYMSGSGNAIAVTLPASPQTAPARHDGVLTGSEIAQFDSWTTALRRILQDSSLEETEDGEANQFIDDILTREPHRGRCWLQYAFLSSIKNGDVATAADIVTLVGKLEEARANPEGHMIAYGAITHQHLALQRSGIKAFANWGSSDCVKYLKTIRGGSRWLDSYLSRVISELERKHAAAGA